MFCVDLLYQSALLPEISLPPFGMLKRCRRDRSVPKSGTCEVSTGEINILKSCSGQIGFFQHALNKLRTPAIDMKQLRAGQVGVRKIRIEDRGPIQVGRGEVSSTKHRSANSAVSQIPKFSSDQKCERQGSWRFGSSKRGKQGFSMTLAFEQKKRFAYRLDVRPQKLRCFPGFDSRLGPVGIVFGFSQCPKCPDRRVQIRNEVVLWQSLQKSG